MGVGLHFYSIQKKENHAIRLKMLSLGEIKKTPLPWSRLTNESIERINKAAQNKIKTKAVVPNEKNNPISEINPEIQIIEQSTEQLTNELTKNMIDAKSLDLPILEKNIEMADEIISRDPNSYFAYKAKLISMIIKEGKFEQAIDESDLNDVLDNMAVFEISSDSAIRRETAFNNAIANQVTDLENKLDNILILEDEVSNQSAALEKSSPEYQELQLQSDQLAEKENLATENLEIFQNNINAQSLSPVYQNEEITEIPFSRLLAKGDYDSVIENAQSFIERFPNSLSGYYFLLKALELQGRADDATRVIDESDLSLEAKNAILDRLDASRGEDPNKFWEKLRF